ncbi:hypothetical protein KV102_11680 [Mumia sp. zg.B53]|uniref:hypothetical protein n=1 Tax=Mumia sp. zg.B53 TaxID=2855449 RepID=UPI001C6E46AD|nr:hypothetical protein [Mumia sp. zg.B53]MBW9215501.1 hypothetical protein [Mumia sp. zg.B53]
MNSPLKRAAAVVAGGALAFSGLAFASAAPSAAAAPKPTSFGSASVSAAAAPTPERPVDIVSIAAQSAYINYKTKGLDVGVTGQVGPNVSYFSMTANVYRGSTRVGTVSLSSSTGSGYLTFRSGWGRGTFRVANVAITGGRTDGSTFAYTDATAGGYFTVKSAIEGNLKYRNVISIKSTGSKKKVKVGVRYYSPTGWKPYRGKKVVVQVKKGKWKKKKALRLNRKGKAGFTFYSSKRAKYRLKIPATKTVQGGYSRGTIKL